MLERVALRALMGLRRSHVDNHSGGHRMAVQYIDGDVVAWRMVCVRQWHCSWSLKIIRFVVMPRRHLSQQRLLAAGHHVALQCHGCRVICWGGSIFATGAMYVRWQGLVGNNAEKVCIQGAIYSPRPNVHPLSTLATAYALGRAPSSPTTSHTFAA